MKTGLTLLLLFLLASCVPQLSTLPSGKVTGMMLMEDDIVFYEYQLDGTDGTKKKHFQYFYGNKHDYQIDSRVDSVIAEKSYRVFQFVNN